MRASVLAALIAVSTASLAAEPHRSWSKLPTGNGHGFAVYDADAARVSFLSEHPYVQPSPGVFTRNVAYDAYFGARANGEAGWLAEKKVDSVNYLQETHVVRAQQRLGPLRAETHVLAPWGLAAPAVVLALRLQNVSTAAIQDARAYALLNFRLGSGAPAPGADGERIDWDASTQSYAETGPSGLTIRYLPIGAGAVHGASPQDVFAIGRAGGELQRTDSSGTRADAVAGFQWALPALAAGEERWAGVLVTLGDAGEARTYLAGRDAQALVQAELDAWNAWRVAPPAGLSGQELRTWRQSETVLRMAQSRQAAPSAGQIIASLPPGQWWISWVRDQAYAVAALARMGHVEEARKAVGFWSTGRVGAYKRYVGVDYAVSVVRYYGNGEEWSDSDSDGPNIEFDGFGLASWAARLAGTSEMDVAAGPLLKLLDPTGLIAPDSSIWERHWNGKQKRFAYTSIAAAAGLCAAGKAAEARSVRAAIATHLKTRAGGIAGSFEELRDQAGALDGSTVEAINFGLLDPREPLSVGTLQQLHGLRAPAGLGYIRNDDGDGYDKQEWVFIDLRASSAFRLAGRAAEADELLAWTTRQADANFGLHAELYDAAAADYAGAVPMVGFGAGAYILALLDRAAAPARPSCFLEAPKPPSSGGCSSSGGAGFAGAIVLVVVLAVRRGRRNQTQSVQRILVGFAIPSLLLAAACRNAPPPAFDADAGWPDAGPSVLGPPARGCTTEIRWNLGRRAGRVAVAGSWNQFSLSADPMFDDLGTGTYRAKLELPPGDYAYKLVADGQYFLDPSNPLSKYVADVENSRLVVGDCNVPELRVSRAQPFADGRFEVDATLVDGAGRAGIDPASIAVTIDGAPANGASFEAATGALLVRATGIAAGKHTARIVARDRAGRAIPEQQIPFWIEAQPFSFSDGLLYLVFVDRFRNGDQANDAPVPGVDPRANFQGGDLKGLLQSIQDGYFDDLGVRTLWLSPINQGFGGAGGGLDGRTYSNYHGYWPTAPRSVEPRLGSLEDLRAVTAAAHARGMRVVLDLVQNDLHTGHPYYRDHANDGWFRGDPSCICATCGNDKALVCWFAPDLADVDFRNTAVTDQLAEDAAFWVSEVGADGFRIDAVKHMEHAAITTLRARLARLEATGQRLMMLGETFDGDRGLLASYAGPQKLTGQFDFALYFTLDEVIARNLFTMADLDASVRASEAAFAGLQMSPFVGNHDVARFLSRANGDPVSPNDAWTRPPPAPDRDEPYQRSLLAHALVLTLPGVPLLIWGDEFGQPGANDPDNRRFMRFGAELNPREAALLAKIRAIGKARATHPGLMRGARRTLHAAGDVYVYARGAGPHLAIVVLNRGGGSAQVNVAVPAELGPQGAALRDVIGGATADVSAGMLSFTIGARSAAVFVR